MDEREIESYVSTRISSPFSVELTDEKRGERASGRVRLKRITAGSALHPEKDPRHLWELLLEAPRHLYIFCT